MANESLLRVSQVLGTPVFPFVIDQLKTRSDNNSRDTRDASNLIYLANKTGWFRIVSSVRMPEFIGDNFLNIFNAPNFSFTTQDRSKTYKHFKDQYPDLIKDEDSLAKQFVLFAGTSAYNKENQEFKYDLRDNSYGILGDEEIKAYGRRPMPGITSVQIDTQGALGSIRAATINFKVWDKDQLDIIDALYFKLGYTMLLEWGNTFYYKTGNSELLKGEDSQIDPFSSILNSKEQINSEIQKKIRLSEGNYDGMLGLVTNFNFTFNQEGGYDCTLKIQALGSLGDSIKINHSSALPNLYNQEVLKYRKNQFDLEKANLQKELDATLAQIKSDQEKALNEELKKLRSPDPLLSLLLNSVDIDNQEIENFKSSPEIIQNLANYNQNYDSKTFINELIKTYKENHGVYDFDGNTRYYYISSGKFTKNRDILFLSSEGTNYLADGSGTYLSSMDPSSANKISVDLDTSIIGPLLPSNVKNVWEYIKNDKSSNFKWTVPSIDGGESLDFYISWEKNSQILNDNALDGLINGSILPTFQLKSVNINRIRVRPPGSSTAFKNDYAEISLNLIVNGKNVATVELNVPSLIKKISYDPQFKDKTVYSVSTALEKQASDAANAKILKEQQQTTADFNKKIKELDPTSSQSNTTQTIDTTQYQSALELMLRSIQLRLFNDKNKAISAKPRVYKSDLTSLQTSTKNPFIDDLFSEGVFKGKIQDLIKKCDFLSSNQKANTTYLEKFQEDYENSRCQHRLLYNAVFGFSHTFMSGFSKISDTPIVTYKSSSENDYAVFNAYILPQRINTTISDGVSPDLPVYIPFGLLLMMINHSCLLYDSKSENDDCQSPIFYIDYNTNTNFCLTNASQLSTDITKFLIGFQGTNEAYQKLFTSSILTTDKTKIVKNKKVKNSAEVKIYTPEQKDFVTGFIPEFKTVDGTNFQGRLMNILVNVDYAAKLVSEFSYRDGTNSVYLKKFLEQMLVDMNKSLGNFNMLRLSYHDPSNVYVIVDDQQTKVANGETQLTSENAGKYELPIFGKKSIAKSIELRTDISSKLGSMIAISANSDVKKQVGLSTDASSFGFINTDFKDRFIPIITDISGAIKKGDITSAAIAEAEKFDSYIKSIYSEAGKYDASAIGFATNYFIQKMSILKNEEPATRASAMIPVSLNISLDGISGFQMTQLFTIGENFLPYNYLKLKDGNPFTSIGFAIVGLTHTIENNQWTTSLRTNMAYLRNSVNDYTGKTQKGNQTYKPQNTSGIQNSNIASVYTNTNDKSFYTNIKFYADLNIGDLNPKLLDDINMAAGFAGVKVTVGFGRNNYTVRADRSRHYDGSAVDIPLVDDKPVSRSIEPIVRKFTDQLAALGYNKDAEGPNKKAYLSFDFIENGKNTHENHVHVSNTEQ